MPSSNLSILAPILLYSLVNRVSPDAVAVVALLPRLLVELGCSGDTFFIGTGVSILS